MITSLDIVYQPETSVVIVNDNSVSIDIINQDPVSIEVSLVNSGPQGAQGPQGEKGDKGDPGDATTLGGVPVVITSPSNYDVIQYVSGNFVNRPQSDITDGGNY